MLWFVVGLVLVLSEFALPGVIFVFIGLGAWVASLTTWLGLTTTLGAQVAVFGVSSLVLLVGLRRFFKKWFMGFTAENPDAKQIMDEFTGKSVRVISPITAAGQGKVEFKGANWNAHSTDVIEAGEMAEITCVEGLVLHVRRKG
jgi:inner membrane protein